MESYFEIFLLIAKVKALFSQPYSRCSRSNSSAISARFPKCGKLIWKFNSYCRRSWAAFSRPYLRCSKSWPSTISQKISKHGELFRDFPPYCSGQSALFTTFIHGVQRPTPWNKSEFFKTWEAVSKNPFLFSAELNGLFTTSFTLCYVDARLSIVWCLLAIVHRCGFPVCYDVLVRSLVKQVQRLK